MEKRRIVIVGGGMAGLAAAFELTRTEELRAKHEVTLYQMGWRLGGKCASSRESLQPDKETDEQNRIVEHGLHIWFGYYENAFRLLRKVLREWRAPDGKEKNIDDAFEPNERAAIGGEGFAYVTWPERPGRPGKGDSKISLLDSIVGTIEFGAEIYDNITKEDAHLHRVQLRVPIPATTRHLILEAGLASELLPTPFTAAEAKPEPPILTSKDVVKLAASWANVARDQPRRAPEHLRGIASLLRSHANAMQEHEAFSRGAGQLVKEATDIGAALVAGIAFDLMLGGMTIAELDRRDFGDWLLSHGAPASAVAGRVVTDIYDIMFQYREGDRAQPSYGAGTATQVVLRLLGTYKGALAWKLRAGMGEVVIAPLYELLKDRIQFRFFHKLIDIGLTPDASGIASLTFARQVDLDGKNYEPTRPCDLQVCWPTEPFWGQIKNGKDLEARGVDFESHWCAERAVGTVTLEQGQEGNEGFDDVILAIPLGVMKRLSTARGPCDRLIAANRRFRAMTENAVLVPSISVQAWSMRTARQLGWEDSATCAVCAPEPLSIWSDMSHLLDVEGWRKGSGSPVSLHYFCGVFASQLYRQPPPHNGGISPAPHASPRKPASSSARARSGPDTQREANELAERQAIKWFVKQAPVLWPKFEWDSLYDAQGRDGSKRIEAQIVRANVDPSDCCVCSAAGTTQWRLKADQSGFKHLYLAGSWTDTGFNTECVEAAVMSGMQASRAICGSPNHIPGEHFLHHQGGAGLLGRALAGLLSLTGAALGWPDVAIGDETEEEEEDAML